MGTPNPLTSTAAALGIAMVVSVAVLTSTVESLLYSGYQQEEIRRVGRLVMNCGQIPGMSLVVVKGSESWAQPFGVTNLTSQEEVKQSTNFVIASLTKALTSTLLLMLLKESKEGYTIDTPLKDILKQDDLFPDEERSKKATVKDILSHRMGLARADLALFAGYPDDFSLRDLSSALSCLPVQATFRDGFTYSNFMYSLAGHVIEKLTNQSYADVLRSRILTPLGMTSTLTDYSFSNAAHVMAQPYMVVDGRLEPVHHTLFQLPVFLPALGLASNAVDMARWLQTLLQQGTSPSGLQVVIPPEVVAMTQFPVTPYIINQLRPRYPQPELTFAYGMGWFQSTYKGFRRMWHVGSLYGFTSMTWLFPDTGLGLFVTTNGPARSQDTRNQLKTLLSYIADPLLGFPSWGDRSLDACLYSAFLTQQSVAATANIRRPSTSTSRDNKQGLLTEEDEFCKTLNESYAHSAEELRKYTGVYYNKLFGRVIVDLEEVEGIALSNRTTLHKKCPNFDLSRRSNNNNNNDNNDNNENNILQVTFGERFSGVLHPTADKNVFQMEPIGVFEFSAHSEDNKETTMPVEFSLEDGIDNVAYKVKAVWQAVEMIHYSRDPQQGMSCFQEVAVSGASFEIRWMRSSFHLMCYCLITHLLSPLISAALWSSGTRFDS